MYTMVSYFWSARKRNALAYDATVALNGSMDCGERPLELDLDVLLVDSDYERWNPDRGGWKNQDIQDRS